MLVGTAGSDLVKYSPDYDPVSSSSRTRRVVPQAPVVCSSWMLSMSSITTWCTEILTPRSCATSAPASSAAPSSTTPPTTSSKPNTPFTTTSTVPPASSPNTSPASSADGPTTGTPAQQTSPSGTPTQQTSPGDSSQTPASPSATQPIASPSPSGSSPSQASPNSSGSTLGTPTTGGASTGSGSSPSGSHGTAPNKTNSNPSGTLVPTDLSSPPSPASTTGQAPHSSNTGLYAGIGVGVVVSLLLLLGGAVVWRRRRIHRAREAEELAAAATFIAGGREKIIQTNEKETALTWVDDLQMHDPAAGAATPVRRGKRAMQAPSLDEQSVGAASSSAPARKLPETDVPHLPAAITPDAADASTPQPNSGPAPVAVPLVTLSTNDLVRELQARMEADAMRSHTEDLPEYIEDEPRR
jgi:hypothetical protein